MSEIAVHFHNDTQLMGYGESDSSGAWVKFQITPEELERFRGLKGSMFIMTLVQYNQDGTISEQPRPRQPETTDHQDRQDSLAIRMHRNGYFYNRALWSAMEESAIYTQDMHKAWIESQPCCERSLNSPCAGQVVGHHVRTSANAGTGIKPDHWYLIPVCAGHHEIIHRTRTRGEREIDLDHAVTLTSERIKTAMKKFIGRDSLSGITEEELHDFEIKIGLRRI